MGIEKQIASNQRETQMNGYKAFYKGKECEVYAATSFAAQTEAAKKFGAKKSYQVSVVLCEKDGAIVSHATQDIAP